MTSHRDRRRGHAGWWAVAVGLVLVALGVAVWLLRPVPGGESERPSAAPSTQEVEAASDLPEATRAPAAPLQPDRIRIPEIGVDSRVVAIQAPGGVLTPPSDPQTLGWWADGARPGDRKGSALVTGHTVSTGGGALDDLEELSRGDDVLVRSAGRSRDYVVRSTVVLGKGDLAERAETLFDQSVSGRLVLITCEDWNGNEYLSNVVVTAIPVDAPA